MIKDHFTFELKVANVVVFESVMSSSFIPSWLQVPVEFNGACFDIGTWSVCHAAWPQPEKLTFFGWPRSVSILNLLLCSLSSDMVGAAQSFFPYFSSECSCSNCSMHSMELFISFYKMLWTTRGTRKCSISSCGDEFREEVYITQLFFVTNYNKQITLHQRQISCEFHYYCSHSACKLDKYWL